RRCGASAVLAAAASTGPRMRRSCGGGPRGWSACARRSSSSGGCPRDPGRVSRRRSRGSSASGRTVRPRTRSRSGRPSRRRAPPSRALPSRFGTSARRADRSTVPTMLASILCTLLASAPAATPSYSIEAIRYATIRDFPVAELVMGAPADEKLDIAMVVWLIRGGGHNVLFDSGFHREKWLREFPSLTDFVRPDEAVRLAGVGPEEI